jgi:arylsulfatase A-like enzyme
VVGQTFVSCTGFHTALDFQQQAEIARPRQPVRDGNGLETCSAIVPLSTSALPPAALPARVAGKPARIEATVCLVVACWVGLVTGLSEVVVLGIRRLVFHQFTFLGPHAVWMGPLTNVVLFAGFGLFLYAAARLWPRLSSAPIVVAICAFPGFLALLLLTPGLSRPAALLLAAGCAVQAGRMASTRWSGFERLVRRSSVWLLILVAALAAGAFGRDWLEQRSLVAARAAASATAPNVLLVVLDTVRAQSLSLYGHSRPTAPNLQRWAQTGTVFDWAFATAPWTTPSHASMFTGRFPYELTAGPSRPGHQEYPVLDESVPTLAEILSAHGYATAGFVANVEYAGYETGLDRGFEHYEDYLVTPSEFAYSAGLGRSLVKNLTLRRLTGFHDVLGRKTADDVNAAFLRWLSGQNGRPFFAFLNYFDAHEPYLPPAPFDGVFAGPRGRDTSRIVPWGVHQAKSQDKPQMTSEERNAELAAYEGAIAYLDHHLDLLLDTLHEQGVLDNTLVIVTSDHGEHFGEHGIFTHGNSLYLPLLHVPLLMRSPGRVPGDIRIPASVSLRDLPATVLDVAGITADVAGESLARWWDGSIERSEVRDMVFAEVEGSENAYSWDPVSRGNMTSLIQDRLHYIRNGDGREELYDFGEDPAEERDLSPAPASQPSLNRFRALLTRLRPSGQRWNDR